MSDKTPRSNSVGKVREFLKNSQDPVTLSMIKDAFPEFKASQISSALCYFLRQNIVTREAIDNTMPKKRKKVWQYKFQGSNHAN